MASPDPPSIGRPSWTRARTALAIVGLLGLHYALAASSLLRENATVDEVAHLASGVTYWQTGTFKLYHHNPPLTKLVAAAPVAWARPETGPLYGSSVWANESQATFAEWFAYFNAPRYFELFDRARLLMPGFTVVGGLVVFAWSARLYGRGAGLLSLALWALCPNILAHGRLVTSDAASAALGVAATYLFWRYQHRPTWRRAAGVGVVLGIAQLTKFSLILLYGFWPLLAVVQFALSRDRSGWPRRLGVGIAQFGLMVGISVLVIDLGYGFEGVGQPLGRFEFASRTLTRPVRPGEPRPSSKNPLLDAAWRYRVNRFRGTVLGSVPVPLPRHYVLGFDEQKVETEGVPTYFFDPTAPRDDAATTGYSVYLNGELRRSGWWYYYLATLAYKLPEGTLGLVGLSVVALASGRWTRERLADEVAVGAVPVGVLVAMSGLTDICLGLRYILAIVPYLYIGAGRVVPWALARSGGRRGLAFAAVGACLVASGVATASIHPSYLAYFNVSSGGPDRGASRLIDSNLDWGQDLVGLDRWLRANRPGQPVGLAYFGQINPTLLRLRGGGFDWFLPPVRPGSAHAMPGSVPVKLVGPAPHLTPGVYAVSASLVAGLPWRFYDPASLRNAQAAWTPRWDLRDDAFGYFRQLRPVAKVGYSIWIYDVTADDARRLDPAATTGGGGQEPGPG